MLTFFRWSMSLLKYLFEIYKCSFGLDVFTKKFLKCKIYLKINIYKYLRIQSVFEVEIISKIFQISLSINFPWIFISFLVYFLIIPITVNILRKVNFFRINHPGNTESIPESIKYLHIFIKKAKNVPNQAQHELILRNSFHVKLQLTGKLCEMQRFQFKMFMRIIKRWECNKLALFARLLLLFNTVLIFDLEPLEVIQSLT